MTFAEQVIKDMDLESVYEYPISESWIISLIESIESRLTPKWQKVIKGQQPEAGSYWVIVKGEITTATVNYDFLPKGFWRYSDYSEDEKLYPTHYLKYSEGLPKLPTTK